MTFAIAGRCMTTGRFGVALSTRPIGVGARCPFIAPNVGIVVSMAYTDPRLGLLGLDLLRAGMSATKVLAEIAESDPHIEHRQICVIDRDGNAAVRSGKSNNDWTGSIARPNVVAMGNNLVSERTVGSMFAAWEKHTALPLEERLLTALEAARDAGGQHGGQHSSAVVVYDRDVHAYVDLRVDLHDEPIGELRRVYEAQKPLLPYYYERPRRDPTQYGREQEWLDRQANRA